MVKVTNIRTRGMLGIKGKRLEPGQSDDIDTSLKDLKNHPFVLEGWLQIETGQKKQVRSQDTKQTEKSQEEETNSVSEPNVEAGSEQ